MHVQNDLIALVVALVVLVLLGAWLWSLRKVVALRTAALDEARAALVERIKERDCLNAVFRATDDLSKPWTGVCQSVVDLLPAGWQHTTRLAARLEWDDQTYTAGPAGPWIAEDQADLEIDGQRRGRLAVGYVQDDNSVPMGTDAFLPEEHALLNAVTSRLVEIAKRRRAEQLTRESEERFRRLFESSPQATMIVRGMQFDAVNAAAVRVFGVQDASELLGRSPIDVSPPTQPDGRASEEKAGEVIVKTFESGSHELEWVFRRADGSLFTARVALTAIREGDHDILHVVFRDITAEKEAEAALSRYRQHLEELVQARTAALEATAASLRQRSDEQKAILDTATAGIMLVRERIIQRTNRSLEELLGYEPGELQGQPTRVLYATSEDWEAAGPAIQETLQRGETYTRELMLQRKDGRLLWARTSARALDPERPELGLVGMLEDISRERAVMEEMERARALAEEAARTKADFLANMSHEIRTPMNAIMGMTHLLQRTPLTDRQRDQLSKIQGASRHLLGIINDILDFSKIEAGKLPIEHIDFNLEDVLREVISFITDRASAKGLELIVDVAPDVPNKLRGDPLRISQILTNYASNAVKFTARGEITLRVRLAQRSDGELLLRFEVTDTGIGLEESQRQRLFRSFEQADTSTTRRFGGTGLGLAISMRLAELMGGTVGVDSTVGEGSTFWFTVRLSPAEGASSPLIPASDLRGRRVLVVDDNAIARRVLAAQLRSMTFLVSAVDRGSVAIDAVHRADLDGQPFEIVFLDWQMPEMSGVATAARIRELPLRSPPHLVMVTAHSRDELTTSARAAGIEEILLKPVTPSILFDTAIQLLQQAPRLGSADSDAVPSMDLSSVAGGRILLVEDNPLNQEVARELLETAGLVVDVAENGAIGVERVQQGHYDMVLMDIQMPVMDGLSATHAIRARPEYAQLPIVAMTANAMPGDRERYLAAGMNDYVAKPIEPDLLWQALLRWLPAQTPNATRRPPPAETRAVTAPGDESVLERVRELGTVNVADGLRRAMGRVPLYRSLLQRFVDAQRNFEAELSIALASGDRVTAQRIVHSLKGSAGQVGALAVQEAALALETTLRSETPNPDQVQAELRQTVQAIAPLLKGLTDALATAGNSTTTQHTEPVPPMADAPPLLDWLAPLQAALDRGDPAAIQWLEDHEDGLRVRLPTLHQPLATAVRNFDFEAALDMLRSIQANGTPRG